MASRMLVRRCSKRGRALTDLVEEVWLAEHRNASFARDLEDLVDECLQVGALAVRAWGDLADTLLSGAELDLDAIGCAFGEAIVRLERDFERVLRLAAEAHACGCDVKRTGELAASHQEIQGIKEEYDRVWATSGDPFALASTARAPVKEPGPGPVVAHTDRPRSLEDMAAELDRLSRPLKP